MRRYTQAKQAKIAQNQSDDCPECPGSTRRTSHCDPEKMAELEAKCRMLVNTCVAPLALQLSDKELEELREKLGSDICWYLTCDRYWSAQGGRRHPNILAILLVILTAGIVFLTVAYYVVWVCF